MVERTRRTRSHSESIRTRTAARIGPARDRLAWLSRRIGRPTLLAVGCLLVVAVDPVFAAPLAATDSLVDIIVEALRTTLRTLFTPIKALIEEFGDDLVALVVETPAPDAVFEPPTNAAWPNLYDYYWTVMLPLALSLYGLAIGIVIFLESTSHLFSSYHRSKLKKRALAGLFGLLSWWWLAAISLRFVSALTGFLVPDLSSVTFFETYSFAAMGLLGVVIALLTDFVLFALVGLIYLVRQVSLYLYVLLMPLLIVFWIPGVGPFGTVANFMKRLAGFYVPFLFMTLPVALLFRLSGLLGDALDPSLGGFGAWLLGLILPFFAVAAPIIFFWQASALFFVADRAAHRIETRRARQRLDSLREGGRKTVRGGRNFMRGTRDKTPLAGRNGGDSEAATPRAHNAGRRLRDGSHRLRSAVNGRRSDRDGTGPASGSASDTDVDSDTSTNADADSNANTNAEAGGDDDGAPTDDDRSTDFSNLRESRPANDDPPRYIH